MIRIGILMTMVALAGSSAALAQTSDPPPPSDAPDFPREGSSFESDPVAPSPAQTAATSDDVATTSVEPPATSVPAAVAATPPPVPAETAAAAESSDDDDEDDSEHFWFDIALGYSWINLVALDQSNFAPEPQTLTSTGPTIEGGLGVELSIIRLGLAGSYSRYKSFDVATAELDLTLVIPVPLVEPYIEAGIGYGWIRNVDETNMDLATSGIVPIRGIAIDLGLGLDIKISDLIQFGVNVDASILNLQRQRATELGTITNVDFTREGTAVGLQVHGAARLTFQF